MLRERCSEKDDAERHMMLRDICSERDAQRKKMLRERCSEKDVQHPLVTEQSTTEHNEVPSHTH